MKASRKYFCLMITCILNVAFFYALDFWKYILKEELFSKVSGVISIILGIGLGLYAVLVLAFSETSVLVQLCYRKKYSAFSRKYFDNNMVIQICLLVFYYISSFVFSKMVPAKVFMPYLVLLPILLAVILTKMSRTVWEKEDAILFMDVNGQLVEIDEIRVGKDTIELIHKSGEHKSIKKTKKIAGLYG